MLVTPRGQRVDIGDRLIEVKIAQTKGFHFQHFNN